MGEGASNSWWLLPNVSAQPYGQDVDDLIVWMHVVMLVLFVGWLGYFLLAIFKFRASRGHKADPSYRFGRANVAFAVGVGILEIFLESGYSVPGWRNLKEEFPAPDKALTVRVVAKQFTWIIHYAGEDGLFGRTLPTLASAKNPMGLDREGDLAAKDDIWTYGKLRVPLGKPVIVRLSSLDVIHSFGVPNLRLKQDVVPGMEIPVWFEAAVEGSYVIACSQLCGNGHSTMKGSVEVLPPAGFEQWLDEQAKELAE